jgi:hypothetical protein
MFGLRIEFDLSDSVDLEIAVTADCVELGAQVIDDIRVGDGFELGRIVEGSERRENVIRAVREVENIGRILAWVVGAVET